METVDLPVAIEPVSPIMSILVWACTCGGIVEEFKLRSKVKAKCGEIHCLGLRAYLHAFGAES